MPTVLRKYGYRFHFYSADGNEPPHIHIDGKGCKAKIWLDDIDIAKATGVGDKEPGRLLAVVRQHRQEMMEAWNEYFK